MSFMHFIQDAQIVIFTVCLWGSKGIPNTYKYLTEMADAQTHKQGKKEPENTEKKDNKQWWQRE